ncbi:MAG: hypothetical protein IIB64_09610 [Proteobacteria bacterium]|nr:hypothetical protein [Pseudomonadota bacterium]
MANKTSKSSKDSFTITVTKWSILKAALYGAIFGIILILVSTGGEPPREGFGSAAHFGVLFGGALGGIMIFVPVALIRNWMVGRKRISK